MPTQKCFILLILTFEFTFLPQWADKEKKGEISCWKKSFFTHCWTGRTVPTSIPAGGRVNSATLKQQKVVSLSVEWRPLDMSMKEALNPPQEFIDSLAAESYLSVSYLRPGGKKLQWRQTV